MNKRSRPNAWYVKYYQWVLAGEIALATHAVSDIEAALARGYNALTNSVYFAPDDHTPHYSIIGQEWLRRIGVVISELG